MKAKSVIARIAGLALLLVAFGSLPDGRAQPSSAELPTKWTITQPTGDQRSLFVRTALNDWRVRSTMENWSDKLGQPRGRDPIQVFRFHQQAGAGWLATLPFEHGGIVYVSFGAAADVYVTFEAPLATSFAPARSPNRRHRLLERLRKAEFKNDRDTFGVAQTWVGGCDYDVVPGQTLLFHHHREAMTQSLYLIFARRGNALAPAGIGMMHRKREVFYAPRLIHSPTLPPSIAIPSGTGSAVYLEPETLTISKQNMNSMDFIDLQRCGTSQS